MIEFAIKAVLMTLALLILVPAATGGGVAVRQGGLIKGLFTLFVIGCLNFCLWLFFGLFTVGSALVFDWLTFGLVGLLINALAYKCTASVFPEVLYVRSYGSAFWAALVMTISSYLITTYVHI